MRFLNAVLTLVLLLMVVAGGAAYVFNSQIEAPGPLDRNKVVVIPKGEGTQEIAARLERDGIITDRRLFVAGYMWARFAAWMDGDKTVQLKAGDFEIRQNASIKQVVDVLSEGRTVTYKVTMPEGLTSHQIVERLKADQSLSGDITAVPAEGSLLPETFVVQRGSDRQTILDNMAAQSKQLMDRLWAQRKKDLPIKSWEEAVILASIVEKETGRNDERAARGGRVPQSAAPEHAPAVRSHHSLRPAGRQGRLGPADPAQRDRRRRPATTPTRSTACPRRRSATRDGAPSRRCSIRPRPRSSTSSPTAPAATSSPRR